ncbi:MAG: class I SAM-dependent methyltransferase [Acidobacteriota bacterium]
MSISALNKAVSDHSGGVPQEDYHKVRFPYDARRTGVWRVIAGYLQPWIDTKGPLLELGAGYGEFTRAVTAGEKWALDQNTDLVPHWAPEVTPLIQSALDPWGIEPGSLGTVFASNFFEHFTLEEGSEILKQAKQALRPGGRLIAIQPNFRLEPRRYFDDYTHRTAYTDQGFRDFLTAMGFKVIHAEPRFMPFTMKSRIPTAEWLVSLYLSLPFRPMAGQFLVIAEKE